MQPLFDLYDCLYLRFDNQIKRVDAYFICFVNLYRVINQIFIKCPLIIRGPCDA